MKALMMKTAGLRKKLFHEMKEYWLGVLYMAVFFSVFTNYRRLILAHHQISYEEYGVSIIKALVLAKVILVAESLRLGRRFDDRPLMVTALYKSFLFTLYAGVFGACEAAVRGFLQGSGGIAVMREMADLVNYEWLAGALVVFFTFIPFFAIRELRKVLGSGTVYRIFFQSRSLADALPGRHTDSACRKE